MEKREQRRDRSWRKARRAQREHLRAVHPTGAVDCVCERSIWYFEKRKSHWCDCGGRKFGNPKIGYGICDMGLRPAVRERIDGRRYMRQRLWEFEYSDPDDRKGASCTDPS